MTEDAWLPVLILFFVAPTILMIFRVYIDIARYIRSGYLTSSVVSLAFAVGSYVFFAAACSMVFWRNNRRFPGMEVADTTLGKGPIPQMEALAVPVHEATVMHSYLIPAGLWLCKASFVAMYFSLRRHLNLRTKRLLYATVAYLVLTFLVLVFVHAFWCGGRFGRQWATTSTDYCTPFSSALAIGIYTFCNVTSDILVMAIPLVILHYITKLPRERYAIFFLLFLGLGTIATTATCCALHITYRKQLMVYYSYVQLAELLACIELSVALMAVSLPSLKGVLYRRSERRQSKMSSSTGTTQTTQTTGKESKRSGSEMRGEVAEEEEAWEEDDERRLVIMRRVSYEVQSMELSELGRPGM